MRTELTGPGGVPYRRGGQGDLSVVFVHGFLDDQYVWDPLLDELVTPGVGFVTVDLAGSGDRTAEDGPFTYDRFAADVGAVVDAVDGPFLIVGHGTGAAVAELVAASRPDRALGLVLVTPLPLAGTGLPDEAIEPFRALGGDGAAQRAMRTRLAADLPQAQLDRLTVTGRRVRAEVVRAVADCWNAGHPAGERPSLFAGPVLIVRGEADGFVTGELVDSGVVPRFATAETVSVGGAGHWVHLEQPTAVAARLDRFLAGLLLSGAAGPQKTGSTPGWTGAFARKSATAFGEAFAADVVLEGSVITRPVEGRAQVMAVMGAASALYETLAFTREATDGSRTYLEWEATVLGGLPVQGITVLTRSASGQIVRAAVHHRPLGAALRFSAELRDRLRGTVPIDLFHQG